MSTPTYLADHCLAFMMGPEGAARHISTFLNANASTLRGLAMVYGNMFIVPTTHVAAPRFAKVFTLNNGVTYWVLDYIPDLRAGAIIQQSIYTPQATSHVADREGMLAPIFFIQRSGMLGISLVDASAKRTNILTEDHLPVNMRGKTTTKLLLTWPGYNAFERQVEIMDSKHQPITHGRLTTRIANFVDDFLSQAGQGIIVPTQNVQVAQRIKNSDMRRDVLILGLVHVSLGHWQPILQVNHWQAYLY